MDSSMFNTLAFKLGVTSEHIIKKAEELVRIAESKSKNSSLSSLNVSSTSITVICIELAAAHNSHHIDKDTAIRLSSLPKKSYVTAYKIVQQMLDMKQDTSISNLSVQFGCSEAQKLAGQILIRYQSSQQNLDLDGVNAELFNAATLYAACKKLKIKIDKTKLVSSTGVKRSVFDRLVQQFEKVATELTDVKKNPNTVEKADKSKNLVESFEEVSDALEKEGGVRQMIDVEEEEDDYYSWKERILKQARDGLKIAE